MNALRLGVKALFLCARARTGSARRRNRVEGQTPPRYKESGDRESECARVRVRAHACAGDQLIFHWNALLELRQNVSCEQPYAVLGDVIWHTGVTKDSIEG